MLRAARFAAQLAFTVDPPVVAAMTAMAERISIISAERIRDELAKLVLAPYPRLGLTLLVETGLAALVLPELPALALERDEHHRHKDVYEHTLTVLEQSIGLEDRLAHLTGGGPDLVSRLAALMHDIGKPRTRRFLDDGSVTFHHHDVVGAKLARKRLQALRFSTETVDAVAMLVELHLRFHGYGDGRVDRLGRTSLRARRRRPARAAARAHPRRLHDPQPPEGRWLRRTYDDLETRIARLSEEEELASIRPDLDGTQIMEILGIPAGPTVGKAYRFLLELRLDEGPKSQDEARTALLAWWAEQD